MINALKFVLLMAALIFPHIVYAEAPVNPVFVATPEATDTPPESTSYKTAGVVSLTSSRDFWLSCIIVGFGILIIVIEFFLLRPVVEKKTEEIAKTYIVTLIIIGTLVLISAGYTTEQIAPALGLFGTIAGYLLGRQANEKTSKETE